MKFVLSLIVGKIIYFIGSIVGKSSNLPGEIALKICPDFFKKFSVSGKILAVTGSNGKTSTANLIAYILRQNGYKVANNAKGSNLTGGIASTFLWASNLNGKIKKDFLVLEVDERFSRRIFKDFQPDYLLCTNLYRDQLTRNGNVDLIVNILNGMIGKDVKLILNGNDPISANLAQDNERVYFTVDRTELSTETSDNITNDAKRCPKCFAKTQYEYYHYNHIGKFKCTGCGYSTPKAKYIAENINLQNGTFTINGVEVKTNYPAVFNIINIVSAVSACSELGLNIESAAKTASEYTGLKQRYNRFKIKDRDAVMILSKNQNPVSFDSSLMYVAEQKEEKSVIIFVNNINHTGHKDTTWLYDITFSKLLNNVNSIVCTGPRAYDLAVALSLAGFAESQILIETNLKNLKNTVAKTKGTLYILSELYDEKNIVSALKN